MNEKKRIRAVTQALLPPKPRPDHGGRYVLVGKRAMPCFDVKRWAESMGETNRRIAEDHVNGLWVSTVFLAIDHSWGPGNRRFLFETMVFTGAPGKAGIEMTDYSRRYSTWGQAERGHKKIVERLRARSIDAQPKSGVE